MKKFSALIALFLCVTIGGVYATWTYAGSDDITDALYEAKVTVTDAAYSGANGTFKVESNLVLEIDQENEHHEAVLNFKPQTAGDDIYLKVTFTPNKGVASDDILENAVLAELYFTTTTVMQYTIDADGNYDDTAAGTAVDIFKFANPGDGNFDENIIWTKQADGTFTYELDETALRAQIALNHEELKGVDAPADGKLVLDTKAEHDAFRTAVSGNIIARVTDGTINN